MNDFKFRRVSTMGVISAERLYLKADGKTVCREGDPEAASLLICAGGEIPIKLARRLGLVEDPNAPKIEVKSPPEIDERSTRPAKAEHKR